MAEIATVDEQSTQHAGGPGSQLAKARAAMGLTQTQVEERLKLTHGVLVHLEQDECPDTVPFTFLRGYIRAYANLVGLKPDQLVAEFNDLHKNRDDEGLVGSKPQVSQVKFVRTKRKSRPKSQSSRMLWFFIVLVLAAALYAFVFVLEPTSQQALPKKNTEVKIPVTEARETPGELKSPIEAKKAQTSGTSTPISKDKVIEQTSPAENKSNEAELEAADVVKPKPAATGLVIEQGADRKLAAASSPLTIRFSGECWLKITDGNNEVVVVGLKDASKEIDIDVSLPLNVVLGNPGVVAMTLNGKAVDLSKYPVGLPANFRLQ